MLFRSISKNTILQAKTGNAGVGIIKFENDAMNVEEDKGIVMDESGNILIIASETLFYEPEQTDPPGIQYSDAELRKEDAAQRQAHNAEVFEVQEREAQVSCMTGRWGSTTCGQGFIILRLAGSCRKMSTAETG